MMSFCKKSVHSFLGLTSPINFDTNDNERSSSSYKCLLQSVSTITMPGGLGLITATNDVHRTPNVVESATVKSSPPPPLLSSSSFMAKKDPGGIGFIDDIGGGVDGLMSCTESLGFESSDERRVDDEIEMCSRSKSSSASKLKWKKAAGERSREVKKFPPPISSLNQNGFPSFFLRPVRKDGRLELTEVRINRPEILRASRQDGRLRLHLVTPEEDSDYFDEDQEEDEELNNLEQEQEQEVIEEEEQEEEEVKEKIEGKRIEEWSFPVTGEGFRRCTDHHHHHNLHMWSRHCVTTS